MHVIPSQSNKPLNSRLTSVKKQIYKLQYSCLTEQRISKLIMKLQTPLFAHLKRWLASPSNRLIKMQEEKRSGCAPLPISYSLLTWHRGQALIRILSWQTSILTENTALILTQ